MDRQRRLPDVLGILQDARFSLRVWRRTPGAFAAVILTLALGIGAGTTIFSAMNAVVFNALPYPEPGRLVQIFQAYETEPNMDRMSVAPANYLDWRASGSFDGMAAFRLRDVNLGNGQPERVRGVEATGEVFHVLAARAAIGRAFEPGDADAAREPVVVLADSLWHRRFEGDRGVVGRQMTIDGRAHTVIGVMPPAFRFPIGWLSTEAEFWRPLVLTPEERHDRRTTGLSVVARIRPEVTRDAAQAELDVIARRLQLAHPDTNAGWITNVFPLRERAAGGLDELVAFLALAVGAIIVIVCLNVANLLLARGLGRQVELTIRAAIGAGRARIVRQLFVEGLVLSSLGGLAGLVLAAWMVGVLGAAASGWQLRILRGMALDGFAVGFAIVLSFVVGVAFSTVPALTQGRLHLRDALRDGARAGSGRRRTRLASALVAAELALATAVLICSATLVGSYQSTMNVDPGFVAERAMSFRVALPADRYPDDTRRVDYFDALEAGIERLPGVVAASVASGAPMEGGGAVFRYRIIGQPAPDAGEPQRTMAQYFRIGTDYLEATGIPLRRGRPFTDADRSGAPRVAIVNEAFARRAFPDGANPLGARLVLEGDVNRSSTAGSASTAIEIVGVVGDIKEYALYLMTPPMIYVPFRQDPPRAMSVVVRGPDDPTSLVPGIRRVAAFLDPELPLYRVQSIDDIVREGHASLGLNALVLVLFGGSAWVLSLVGVYGVFASSVAQRMREFGVRLALGATPRDLLRLVLSRGARLTAIGLVAGVLISRPALALLAGALKTFLNLDLPTGDAMPLAIVSALVVVAATSASLVPARRASATDPAVVLRQG